MEASCDNDADPQQFENRDETSGAAAATSPRAGGPEQVAGEPNNIRQLLEYASTALPSDTTIKEEVDGKIVNDHDDGSALDVIVEEPTFPDDVGLAEAAATAAALAQQRPLLDEKPGVYSTLSVADPTRLSHQYDDEKLHPPITTTEELPAVLVKIEEGTHVSHSYEYEKLPPTEESSARTVPGEAAPAPLFPALAGAPAALGSNTTTHFSPPVAVVANPTQFPLVVENPIHPLSLPPVQNPVAAFQSNDGGGGGVPTASYTAATAQQQQQPVGGGAAAAAQALQDTAAAAAAAQQHPSQSAMIEHHHQLHPTMMAPGHFAVTLDSRSHPPTLALNQPSPDPMMVGHTTPRPNLPVPNEDEVDLTNFPYEVRLGKDVISGKGGKVQQVNRHFRNLVAAEYPQYDSTSSKISKRKIGLKIYHEVIERGGRFLDYDGNVMDQPKAVLKVMKALKDAKTWTSDAKRLAKRRREESGAGVAGAGAAGGSKGSGGGGAAATKKELDGTASPPNKRARKPAPTRTAPLGVEGVKTAEEQEEEGQDGSGLALLYQAIDGDKVEIHDI